MLHAGKVTTMTTLREILKDAEEELRDQWSDMDTVQRRDLDIVHEIADSNVPVYTSDILEVASNDIDMATLEPELGPAYDGSPTPVNIIAANIYEAITEHLYEVARELQQDEEDEEE